MASWLNLASAGYLQRLQTVADRLLRFLVTLPLVIELQARPLIQIHGLEVVGSPERAIGLWLRREQRPVGPANSQSRVSMGNGGNMDCGSCLGFALNRV